MLTLYDNLESGNGHKVRLLLSLLGTEYQLIEKDIHTGETRTPEFLAMNPNGRIPLLVLADGRHLPESNAILSYLAEGTAWMPDDRFERAQVLSWMFFEQYNHEPNVAVARFWCHHLELTPERLAALEAKREQGRKALQVMELQLSYSDWLVGSQPSIADIALYSYTSVADEGGYDLAAYPGIKHWLARMESLSGFIPMVPFDAL